MTRAGSSLGGLAFAARALRHRNYRLFFAGHGVSLIGTWITRVATGWLVYQLTGSPFWLGMVGFVGLAPAMLLTPLGGVLVDRWSRHHMLLCTQFVAMLTSFGLAYFALAGTITVAHVIVLGTIHGISNAFDIPARQAFVVEMIADRADLASAIALNSTIFNGARLIGPSIAGLLIHLFGEGLCFLIDGVSFLAVIGSLLAMRLAPAGPRPAQKHMLHDLREGFSASFGFAPIRAILLLMALVALVGAPYMVLMPIFADRVLGGDARTLGFLTAASGVGALFGALFLAARRSVLGLGRVIAGCTLLFGCGLIAFSLARQLWLSLLILVVLGFGMMVLVAGSNTVVQSIVDDRKRGRVMAFFVTAFNGMLPLGSLLGGELADRISAPRTVLLGGGLCVVGALLFARALPRLRPLVRPIYEARGIIVPPSAD